MDNDREGIRMFFAIPLAEELLEPATTVVSQIMQGQEKIKPVSRENLHITLKFVGGKPQAIVGQLTDVGERIAGQHQPFEMTIAGVGAFPRPKSPSVVWLGVKEGRDAVIQIANQLDRALDDKDLVEPEDREFHPHATIARNKGSRRRPELTRRIKGAQDTIIGRMTVDAFTLMRSDLSPQGPKYSQMHTFKLGHNNSQ